MKVLITGVDGFIGSNLARALIRRDVSVRGLVLPDIGLQNIQGMDVEVVEGDITRPETLKDAVKGVDIVFHLAALASDWGPSGLFMKVNTGGTENMLKASVGCGVRRFVHMSSLAIHRFSGHYYVNEDTKKDCKKIFPYGVSKIRAEEIVEGYYKEGRIETTIIRPGLFPFGPNDMTSFYHLAVAMEQGIYGYVNRGNSRLCTAYVENLTDGMILASTHEKAIGQTYIIADGIEITWRELTEKFCRALGCPYPRISVPFELIYPVAWTWEGLYRLLGVKKPPILTRYRVSVPSRDFYFDIKKARDELGYEPGISLDEGIERTVRWYKKKMVDGWDG